LDDLDPALAIEDTGKGLEGGHVGRSQDEVQEEFQRSRDFNKHFAPLSPFLATPSDMASVIPFPSYN